MKVMTYRELESKDELLPLLDHAFGWTFNQRSFDKFAKIDPRLMNSPIGFCVVESGHVVGYVGVMDLATLTSNGNVEYVGGIYGVATLPSHVRRGISTTLINEAHRYFRDQGYRFSLLGTSHTIVAHSLYQKLGYTNLFERPSAYKIMTQNKTKTTIKGKSQKLDLDRILVIYKEHVKGKTGLVVRDKTYLELLEKTEGLTARDCVINDAGYVLFRVQKIGAWVNGIWIREFVASDSKEMNKLLDLVEERAKDMIYDRTVLDRSLLQVYRSCNYMIHERSHSVLMVKPLTSDASFKQVYSNRFFMTGLDFF